MTQISRLEEQLEHKRQHIARLEARLEVQKDYDDLKREIRCVWEYTTLQNLFAVYHRSFFA